MRTWRTHEIASLTHEWYPLGNEDWERERLFQEFAAPEYIERVRRPALSEGRVNMFATAQAAGADLYIGTPPTGCEHRGEYLQANELAGLHIPPYEDRRAEIYVVPTPFYWDAFEVFCHEIGHHFLWVSGLRHLYHDEDFCDHFGRRMANEVPRQRPGQLALFGLLRGELQAF